jgi:hypothetical protein
MKTKWIVSVFFIFLLAACGQEGNKKSEEVNFLDPIEVELTTTTELAVNEEIVTQAFITQNDIPVTDANEVVFEIWQHGNPETYRFIEAQAQGNGIYEVTWSASEEGVYYVFYHVTAKGMHRMEKHQLVVGEVDVESILATPDERPKKHMH